MLAPNFPVWISKSIAKHFDDALGGDHLFIIEGEQRQTNESTEHIELRIDGPTLHQLQNGVWHIVVEVNLLVVTSTGQNVYQSQQICGEIQAKCTDIVLNKIDDDGTIVTKLGCLTIRPRLRDNIVISHFGQIKPDVPIIQSTVEVHYHTYIKENSDNGSD